MTVLQLQEKAKTFLLVLANVAKIQTNVLSVRLEDIGVSRIEYRVQVSRWDPTHAKNKVTG